jgi:hypothetical protein
LGSAPPQVALRRIITTANPQEEALTVATTIDDKLIVLTSDEDHGLVRSPWRPFC